jgi:hypothetical protein
LLTFCIGDFKGPCDQSLIATIASPPLEKTKFIEKFNHLLSTKNQQNSISFDESSLINLTDKIFPQESRILLSLDPKFATEIGLEFDL